MCFWRHLQTNNSIYRIDPKFHTFSSSYFFFFFLLSFSSSFQDRKWKLPRLQSCICLSMGNLLNSIYTGSSKEGFMGYFVWKDVVVECLRRDYWDFHGLCLLFGIWWGVILVFPKNDHLSHNDLGSWVETGLQIPQNTEDRRAGTMNGFTPVDETYEKPYRLYRVVDLRYTKEIPIL